MRFFFIFGMILSAIMVMATPIDSVESANSTQTNEDAIVENKSTEQMNEDAIVENKSTEQTNEDAIVENKSTEQMNEDAIVENKSTERAARKMYIKRRLAEMDKEADGNETKHRLDEGTGIGGRCTRHVLGYHTLEPSKYTVHRASYWFPEHMCPEGTFAKKYQIWQDDSYWDQKGLTYVGLCCLPVGRDGSFCDSNLNWIWSGSSKDPDNTGKIVRKVGCCGDVSCPNPSPNKWVTGMRAYFKNHMVGAIHLTIGCDQEPFVPGVGWSRPTTIGWSIPHYAVQNNPDAEDVLKFCESDKNDRSKTQAICGFRLHGEVDSAANDSGINKIKFFCCALPQGHHGI